jgi:hypothetical protein
MPHWITSLLFGCVPLAVAAILRIILDLRIAAWLIKIFSHIPVRSLFRDAPPDVSGNWDQNWDTDSTNFSEPTDRHSNARIYQFGRYCFAEFTAKKLRYCLFGRIRDGFIFGEWYPKSDKIGYFGAFKLRIVSDRELKGIWLGHSQATVAINHGDWTWSKSQ